MKSPKPSRSRRFILGLVFAGAMLGFAEVAARLVGTRPAYRQNALGVWRVTFGLENQSFSGDKGDHNFRVSTNTDGFRTNAFRVAPDDHTRIALMGDSTVFGWGVDDHETFAEVGEARLVGDGHRIQVINFGQPGYSTAMVGELFRESVAAYQPDHTIVFIPMHDYSQALISDVEFLQGAATVSRAIRSLLVRHVALYEVLRRRLYPLASQAQLLPHQASKETRVARVSEDERIQVLNEMRAVAAEWGGEVSVGFLPFYSDLQGLSGAPQSHSGATSMHLMGRPGVESLRAWSVAHDRPMFDLRDCCARGARDRTFDFDHTHLNALGNREVGWALAERIAPPIE
jgi:lysophospholipase L1-like esterase